MPLVILAIGILVLFFLIVKVKLNSFLALLLVAGLVGLAEGMPVDKLIPTIEKRIGRHLGRPGRCRFLWGHVGQAHGRKRRRPAHCDDAD